MQRPQVSILKEEKRYKTKPLWTLQINYGLLGTKKYVQNEPDTTGGGIAFWNAVSIPYERDIPGDYYIQSQKVFVIGYNINLSKDFKISNNFNTGIGIGISNGTDKGSVIYHNPRENNSVTQYLDININTFSIFSKFNYHYDINDHLFLGVSLMLYYYFPTYSNYKPYLTSSILPVIGTEQDLSISINYKF